MNWIDVALEVAGSNGLFLFAAILPAILHLWVAWPAAMARIGTRRPTPPPPPPEKPEHASPSSPVRRMKRAVGLVLHPLYSQMKAFVSWPFRAAKRTNVRVVRWGQRILGRLRATWPGTIFLWAVYYGWYVATIILAGLFMMWQGQEFAGAVPLAAVPIFCTLWSQRSKRAKWWLPDLVLAVCAATLLTCLREPTGGVTLVDSMGVASKYTSITEALEATPPGGTVKILPGVYEEMVVLKKPVILEGAGRTPHDVVLFQKANPVLVAGCAATIRNVAVAQGKVHWPAILVADTIPGLSVEHTVVYCGGTVCSKMQGGMPVNPLKVNDVNVTATIFEGDVSRSLEGSKMALPSGHGRNDAGHGESVWVAVHPENWIQGTSEIRVTGEVHPSTLHSYEKDMMQASVPANKLVIILFIRSMSSFIVVVNNMREAFWVHIWPHLAHVYKVISVTCEPIVQEGLALLTKMGSGAVLGAQSYLCGLVTYPAICPETPVTVLLEAGRETSRISKLIWDHGGAAVAELGKTAAGWIAWGAMEVASTIAQYAGGPVEAIQAYAATAIAFFVGSTLELLKGAVTGATSAVWGLLGRYLMASQYLQLLLHLATLLLTIFFFFQGDVELTSMSWFQATYHVSRNLPNLLPILIEYGVSLFAILNVWLIFPIILPFVHQYVAILIIHIGLPAQSAYSILRKVGKLNRRVYWLGIVAARAVATIYPIEVVLLLSGTYGALRFLLHKKPTPAVHPKQE